MKKTTTPSPAASPFVLPQPFTIEQMRADIVDIYLLQLRTTYLLSTDAKIWELAGKTGIREGEIWMADCSPQAYGLSYEDVQNTPLAEALEQQYSFGFLGYDNNMCEPMHDETMHTWTAAYLTDLKNSVVAAEWAGYAPESVIDVSRCFHACALANARLVLEGREGFFPYMSAKENDAHKVDQDVPALTVPQMALLAGMEEMSIRAAISRPGANQLKSFKDDRRTLIRSADAKAWLQAKGRYVTVSDKSHSGEVLNLEKTSFLSIRGFEHAISARIDFYRRNRPELNVEQRLIEISIVPIEPLYNFFNTERLLNAELMKKLGEIIDLPPGLLALKAKEAVYKEELAKLADQMQQVNQ